MKYKIELIKDTINVVEEQFQDTIETIYFDTLEELQRFYYDLDKRDDLQLKWRGYILRSFEYYELDGQIHQNELRKYFKIFPNNPQNYKPTGACINNLNLVKNSTDKSEKKGNSEGFKVILTIILCILFFPLMLIIGGVNNTE